MQHLLSTLSLHWPVTSDLWEGAQRKRPSLQMTCREGFKIDFLSSRNAQKIRQLYDAHAPRLSGSYTGVPIVLEKKRTLLTPCPHKLNTNRKLLHTAYSGSNAHSDPENYSANPTSAANLEFSKNYWHRNVRFWTFGLGFSERLRN